MNYPTPWAPQSHGNSWYVCRQVTALVYEFVRLNDAVQLLPSEAIAQEHANILNSQGTATYPAVTQGRTVSGRPVEYRLAVDVWGKQHLQGLFEWEEELEGVRTKGSTWHTIPTVPLGRI